MVTSGTTGVPIWYNSDRLFAHPERAAGVVAEAKARVPLFLAASRRRGYVRQTTNGLRNSYSHRPQPAGSWHPAACPLTTIFARTQSWVGAFRIALHEQLIGIDAADYCGILPPDYRAAASSSALQHRAAPGSPDRRTAPWRAVLACPGPAAGL